MICDFKHTKYQPDTMTEWACPKCGQDNKHGNFCIEDGVNGECELLHIEDEIKCYGCGWSGSGKEYADYIVKKLKMTPCPCCNGRGYVKKSQ